MNKEPNKGKLRYAFFGTPPLTLPLLDTLSEQGLPPLLVVSTPDRPRGRGMELMRPPSALWAEEHGIPLLQPDKLTPEFVESLKVYDLDLILVVAYGKILPQSLIDLPPFGIYNVHYSLLPRWRGATPVESAILHGDSQTGVTIQKMAFELDAGAIVRQESVTVFPTETTPELRDRLNMIARDILPETLLAIYEGKATFTPQRNEEATYCKKIEKGEGLIILSDDPLGNYRKYRTYFGWPGSYFFIEKNSKQIRVLIKKASLEDGAFMIERVVPEGKKEMDYKAFLSA